MSANETQIGGDHYKSDGEEHWDRMWRLYGRGYFVGCITKYVERYHKKNGIEDLNKAQHFLQKLIELETSEIDNDKTIICLYCEEPQQEDGTLIHKEGCPRAPSLAESRCSSCGAAPGAVHRRYCVTESPFSNTSPTRAYVNQD